MLAKVVKRLQLTIKDYETCKSSERDACNLLFGAQELFCSIYVSIYRRLLNYQQTENVHMNHKELILALKHPIQPSFCLYRQLRFL